MRLEARMDKLVPFGYGMNALSSDLQIYSRIPSLASFSAEDPTHRRIRRDHYTIWERHLAFLTVKMDLSARTPFLRPAVSP